MGLGILFGAIVLIGVVGALVGVPAYVRKLMKKAMGAIG